MILSISRYKLIILSILIPVLFSFGLVLDVNAQVNTPRNLQVNSTSSCALQLEWEGEAASYNVERQAPNGSTYGVEYEVPHGTDGSINYLVDYHNSDLWEPPSDDPIDPGTTFRYKVQSQSDQTETSGWTAPESATTDELPSEPGIPGNVTSTITDSGNIEVSWTEESPTSNLFDEYGAFEIYISTSNDGGDTYSSPTRLDRLEVSEAGTLNGKYFYETSDNNKDVAYRYTVRTQEVGGYGCDFTRDEHTVFSEDSDSLYIPVRPGSFEGSFSDSPRRIELSWDDIQTDPNEDSIELQRSTDEDFSSYTTEEFNSDQTSYNDNSITEQEGQTYYYRIRSCFDNICSFWSPTVGVTTGLPVPSDMEARASYATTTYGNISVSWQEYPILPGSSIVVERSTSGGDFEEVYSQGTPRNYNGSYVDEELPLGNDYTYRAKIVDEDGTSSGYSNESSAEFNLSYILKGVSWASIDSSANPEDSGAGWIKLNSDPENGVSSPDNRYSVLVSDNEDGTGNLFGAAWSENFGWLSFYEDDLSGCPTGTCEATVDLETGEFSGWGRFLGLGGDGWVKLSGNVRGSNDNYGIEFADTSPTYGDEVDIEGQSWGSDEIGWVDWEDCNGNCTARGVYVGSSAPVVDPGPAHEELTVERRHNHSGASATDADGDIVSSTWSFVSCPGSTCPELFDSTKTFEGGGEDEPVTITGPGYSPNDGGEYRLRLTVEDSEGNTGDATITERAYWPPEITNLGTQHTDLIWYEEHQHTGARATDEDGDLDSYTWEMISCSDTDGNEVNPDDCPSISNASGDISGADSGNSIKGPDYTPRSASITDYHNVGITSTTIRLTVEDERGNTDTQTFSEAVPACSDGVDGPDGDGLIDWEGLDREQYEDGVEPDPDCEAGDDNDESAEGFQEFDFFFEEQ